MRLFVGIELDPAVRASAGAAIAVVRREVEARAPGVEVRWLPSANLHLTLAFIGEVADETGGRISNSLTEGLSVPRFELAFAGAGAFPASGSLRVMWIGVREGERSAGELHTEVTARLSRLPLRFEERAYSPHLTIARLKDVRGPRARNVREVLRTIPVVLEPQQVTAVTLFRSRASSAGATYDVLMRVPLLG